MSLLRFIERFLRWSLIITSLILFLPALATGEEPGAEDRARASAAFRQGQNLFANGEYLDAAAAFESAYRLVPHPSALANMGFCFDEAGDVERAVAAFRKYMKRPNPQTPGDTAKIEKYLERAKSQVGDLTVKCSLMTCEVTVDEVPRGVTPINLVLLAGAHSVAVAGVDGAATRRQYTVTVPGGGERVLDVDLTAPPSIPSTGAGSRFNKEPPRLRAPFWITSSATVAGLGVITTLGVLNYRNMKDFEEGGSTDPELKKRGDRLTLGINLAVGLTAAAATAAVIFAIVDFKRFRKRNENRGQSVDRSRALHLTFNGSSLVLDF